MVMSEQEFADEYGITLAEAHRILTGYRADPCSSEWDQIRAILVDATGIVCSAPPAENLVASANGPYTGNPGVTVTLSGSARGGTTPYAFAWDLDNDGFYETPMQNPQKSWASDGIYNISLQVTDPAGRKAVDATTVTIAEPLPPSTTWPWPLSIAQPWFEDLWNHILQWFHDVVGWIYDRVKPLFDTVWTWITTEVGKVYGWIQTEVGKVYGWIQGIIPTVTSAVSSAINTVWSWLDTWAEWLLSHISLLFNQVWSWLQTGFNTISESLSQFAGSIYDKVSQINDWFSSEFIDPFIDWLVQLPGKLWQSFDTMITAIGHRLETWFTHDSPGFLSIITSIAGRIWDFIQNGWYALDRTLAASIELFDKDFRYRPVWFQCIEGALLGVVTFFTAYVIGEMLPALGAAIMRIGPWMATAFGRIGGWIATGGTALGTWLASILPRIGGWFASQWVPLLGSSAILGAAATGKLQELIDKIVTPAISKIMDWAEGMGPVAPSTGRSMITGVTKLATFTVSGLAAMTLAGEALSPLKHIGLGHISAVLYDLINYKTLTAAFMGTLAFIYIRTPLTYYYNKVARPNIPDERGLRDLVGDYELTQSEYVSWMAFHGYTDDWSAKIFDTAFRPLTPYMLRSLAEAGLLPEEVLDRELHHAGYREEVIPIIKQMMINLAAGTLAAVSSSTAMTRYQEGFDDETALRQNLTTLGIAPQMLDRYVFAANLKYLYDYQTDLKTFYIDEYHRRVIEEPELRSSLVEAGLATERLDLVVGAQKIKRLAASAKAADPAIAVEEATIREQRTKELITADQEKAALVSLGKELPYALAITKQDTVKLTPKATVTVPVLLPEYETEAGKVQVDTIRRLRRQGQSSSVDELAALGALEMPADLAQAIVDNDALRIKTSAAGGA